MHEKSRFICSFFASNGCFLHRLDVDELCHQLRLVRSGFPLISCFRLNPLMRQVIENVLKEQNFERPMPQWWSRLFASGKVDCVDATQFSFFFALLHYLLPYFLFMFLLRSASGIHRCFCSMSSAVLSTTKSSHECRRLRR